MLPSTVRIAREFGNRGFLTGRRGGSASFTRQALRREQPRGSMLCGDYEISSRAAALA
jgi:hypothetical protein